MAQPSHASLSFQMSRSNEMHLNALMHACLLQVQGRFHPEHIPVNSMDSIIDLGCGAGEWIFDLAKRYPKLRIYGIDSNIEALSQAKIRRNTSSLRQVELRHMDSLQEGLPVPDACVDFVHVQRFARSITPQAWPSLIRECVRVLRPSGWLNIVELELCEISSSACLTIHRAVLQARAELGQTLDETGRTLGVAQRLYALLLNTDLYDVGYDAFTIDLGIMGGATERLFLADSMRQACIMKPVVVQQGILESEEFDTLIEQACIELEAPNLCGWAMLLSVYGRSGGGLA